jgi:hypothetical protein
VRLLECTHHHTSEIEPAQVPPGLADALRYHDSEPQLPLEAITPEDEERDTTEDLLN